MSNDLEVAGRDELAQLVDGVSADELALDADMSDVYGLTSMNKVLFLTAVCDRADVALSNFTEQDVARMRTLGDVLEALASHAEQLAR